MIDDAPSMRAMENLDRRRTGAVIPDPGDTSEGQPWL
jgi:hypothetical protein